MQACCAAHWSPGSIAPEVSSVPSVTFGAASAAPMDKTIAKLLHAAQPTTRTNRIVPPPDFPVGQYGETRRVGKLRAWNKVPYVEKHRLIRTNRSEIQCCPRPKRPVSVQAFTVPDRGIAAAGAATPPRSACRHSGRSGLRVRPASPRPTFYKKATVFVQRYFTLTRRSPRQAMPS